MSSGTVEGRSLLSVRLCARWRSPVFFDLSDLRSVADDRETLPIRASFAMLFVTVIL